MLTKWEQARSSTLKLTTKAQYAEITLSISIWPCGVGVRRFKRSKGAARQKYPPGRTAQSINRKQTNTEGGTNITNQRLAELTSYYSDVLVKNRFQKLFDRGEYFASEEKLLQ